MTMLEPDVKKCRFSDETGLMLKKFMLYTESVKAIQYKASNTSLNLTLRIPIACTE